MLSMKQKTRRTARILTMCNNIRPASPDIWRQDRRFYCGPSDKHGKGESGPRQEERTIKGKGFSRAFYNEADETDIYGYIISVKNEMDLSGV